MRRPQHYGNALRNTGQLVPAVEALGRGVELAGRLGGAISVEALVNLSVVYGDLGDRTAQQEMLESAVAAAALAGLHAYRATCHYHLGMSLEHDGNLLAARQHFSTALQLADQVGDRRMAAAIKDHLGHLKL